MRHHLRAAVPLAVAAGIALGSLAAAGVATATPAAGAAAAKPAPATRPAVADPDRACTLSPSLTHPSGETASCLAVGATLSSLPTVGHTATLTITVKAARAEVNTQVTIDLPRTFAFADGTATHPAYTGAGPVTRSVPATLSLAAGQSRSFTRTVKAIGTGFGEIAAVATNRIDAQRTDGGHDSIFLTTARSGVQSHLGLSTTASRTNLPTARGTTAATRPERVSATPLRTVPSGVHPSRQVAVHPNTAGTSCVTGIWQYIDPTGAYRPGHNVLVEVINSANTQLAYGLTGGDGSYTICYSTGGATTNVYVKFVLSNNIWTVQDFSNNVYNFSTGIVSIADGTTYNFGPLIAGGDASNQRASHAFQLADDEYQWVYQYYAQGAGCWSPFETTCRQLVIHWANDNTTMGTNWNASRGVWLLAGSPDSNSEPLHEYGHNLMYELYGDNFPANDCPAQHFLFAASGTNCGWTEGWADWVSTSVLDSSVYTFNGGATADFNITWNQCGNGGCDTGPTVEGRVVQAMRSLSDPVKGPFDNDPGEGNGNRDNRIWFSVLNADRPNNFGDVWNDRAALGCDVTQTALSALYEGTIDYGFRNPLYDYASKHLPEAVPAHNYSHTTSTGYWSVVAAKPDAGTDVDLSLFSDYAQSAAGALGTSEYGGTVTDFVAINSNSGHRALQTYYPRVIQYAGTGGYTIQEAQGSNILTSGASTNYVPADQLVRVWDSYQTAGVPIYYRAVDASGQDVQLASAGANSDVLTRINTVQGADPGYNSPATLVVNPGATGYAGLVLLNNGQSAGYVTVYADSTAPTGSVSVNHDPSYSRTVGLTLSASDPETGVQSMQISTDGTFDTEPVLPYSTTGSAYLSGPSGTKTVYVRYLDNAGIWSAPVSDTVYLQLPPAIASIAPTTGRASGGQSVVITGTDLAGATAVKFGSTPASSFTVNSSTQITAVTPAHALGVANVYVTTAAGTSTTGSSTRFTYADAPAVTSVTPSSGTTSGGNTVTIVGTGFTNATAVKFSGTAASSFTVVSASKITAVTPAHAAGQTNITVSTPSGLSAVTSGDRYTYANAPTVTGVSPNSGPVAGGQTITVTGTGFSGVTAVKFNSTAAASYTVKSSTKIVVVTPARSAATTNVVITAAGGTSAIVAADRYTFS